MKVSIKKIITVLASAALITSILTGCGAGESQSGNTGNTTKVQTVSTDGSTSMEKVIGYLSEAYSNDTGIKVTYNPTGSGAGIQAVSEGRCDIGLSSRELTDEEKKTLNADIIAIDGIAIVVNPENPIKNLSMEDIKGIYTGDIESWDKIGGNSNPIVCIGRESASGTRDGFEAVTGTKDKCEYDQELTSTGDVIQTVAGNPNAIGYASLASVNDKVKLVDVENVTPTTESIQNGAYKVQRNFILVTKKDTPLSENAQAFFDFTKGKKAEALIIKAGAVPVKR